VQVGLLGPFEVRTDDGVLAEVPGARLRGLLIVLALQPGHVVPKATLVDWIWGERPPSDAANALQRLASRLRKVLPTGSIEGQPGGYRLTVAPDAVDALRFERLLAQARQEEGPGRVRLLREALALWRGAAMQDVAAGEAQAAMRLAAAAGWYWWLGGHKTEGIELLTAATSTQGEVTDDIRAVVYAIVVHFVSSGRGDENTAAEWIHRAYRFSQRSRSRDPRLAFVAPLERMLQTPDDFLPAWEALLDNEDSWVRALARLQVGKMRIVLGRGARDADAYLEMALAEFRALGERFGISIALTELAERLAVRGEFAGACARYERAIAAVTEVGAIDDVIVMRSRQAQLYWLLGDEDASAAAIAEAERWAERVTWPDALAELALSKAKLARWGGHAEEAHKQLDLATTMLGDEAEQPNIRAVTHDLLGYLADDLSEARTHRVAACQAASEAGHAPLIAQILVGFADLALRYDQHEQAARLLAASAGVRGMPDRSDPDVARIERDARHRLGESRFAEAAQEGTQTSWSELVSYVIC
jgi:tetratricopeptide (TPR) repeat protein